MLIKELWFNLSAQAKLYLKITKEYSTYWQNSWQIIVDWIPFDMLHSDSHGNASSENPKIHVVSCFWPSQPSFGLKESLCKRSSWAIHYDKICKFRSVLH